MFSWICPRCGRENRPSDTECPTCRERDAEALAAQPHFEDQPTAEVPREEALRYQQPPAYAPPPPPPPAYAQPRYTPPQRTPEPPPPVYAQQRYAPPQQQPEPPRYAPAPPPPPPPVAAAVPDPLRAPLQHADSRRYADPPPPPPRRSLPIWLLIPLFTFAFLGLGAAVFYGYQRFQKGGAAGFTGGETPANPKPKAASPLQKYIEVVGIRLTQDAKKRPEARFVVVNHANTEFSDLNANVTLWASTSRSEEDSVGTFTFKLANIGPNEAKEVTTPLKTKLKIYEMPDWQNATAEVQITSQP